MTDETGVGLEDEILNSLEENAYCLRYNIILVAATAIRSS